MIRRSTRIAPGAATLMVLASVTVLIFDSVMVLRSANRASPWKTQQVEYRNRHDPSDRIEFQMRDLGALGWRSRVVRVSTGLLSSEITPFDTNHIDSVKWRAVHESVNELGIKYP